MFCDSQLIIASLPQPIMHIRGLPEPHPRSFVWVGLRQTGGGVCISCSDGGRKGVGGPHESLRKSIHLYPHHVTPLLAVSTGAVREEGDGQVQLERDGLASASLHLLLPTRRLPSLQTGS